MNAPQNFLNRRTALASLAGLGAAVGLPKLAIAADHPDAALIKRAAEVEAIATHAWVTLERLYDLEKEHDRLHPVRVGPAAPPRVKTFDMSFERGADDTIICRRVSIVPDPAAVLAVERYEAAMAVLEAEWKAESDEITHRIGLDAAEKLYDRLINDLEDATRDLTRIAPTTWAGLVAKARVVLSLDPDDNLIFNDWEDKLRKAVLRDVLTIGGAA